MLTCTLKGLCRAMQEQCWITRIRKLLVSIKLESNSKMLKSIVTLHVLVVTKNDRKGMVDIVPLKGIACGPLVLRVECHGKATKTALTLPIEGEQSSRRDSNMLVFGCNLSSLTTNHPWHLNGGKLRMIANMRTTQVLSKVHST